jgi:hypothetical protein
MMWTCSLLHGSAAALARWLNQAYAEAVKHTAGGAIDVRVHRRLGAAGQRQHDAVVGSGGHGPCSLCERHFRLQHWRKPPSHRATCLHCCRKQARSRQRFPQRVAQCRLERRTAHVMVDNLASDIEQSCVLDTGRARRFAGPASQAAVEMESCFLSWHLTLRQLFN